MPFGLGACRARLLEGKPRRDATALQMNPSCRQRLMVSCFCCAVSGRLVVVGLASDGQSGGHGVIPTDLSLKPGKPHAGLASGLCSWPIYLQGYFFSILLGSAAAQSLTKL